MTTTKHFTIGSRWEVAIPLSHRTQYAQGCAESLHGVTGAVEKIRADGEILIAFDKPAPRWWANQSPVTGFWFHPDHLRPLNTACGDCGDTGTAEFNGARCVCPAGVMLAWVDEDDMEQADEDQSCSLAWFLAHNVEGLDETEIARVRALGVGESTNVGGGAAPTIRVTRTA